MRSSRPRTMCASGNGPATTAKAVVALVAITALMASVPGGPAARGALLESRAVAAEAPAVRAVAAAVAAAARELVGVERIDIAKLEHQFVDLLVVAAFTDDVCREHGPVIPSGMVAECLLDLPPPVC